MKNLRLKSKIEVKEERKALETNFRFKCFKKVLITVKILRGDQKNLNFVEKTSERLLYECVLNNRTIFSHSNQVFRPYGQVFEIKLIEFSIG